MNNNKLTLDDLHDDEIQDLLANASPSTFFNPELVAARRTAVLHFDTVTLRELREALRAIERTTDVKSKRGLAVWRIHQALSAVLGKIANEEDTGLEQFGPIKRAMTFAVGGPDIYGDELSRQAHAQTEVPAAEEFAKTLEELPEEERIRRAASWVLERAFSKA